MQAALDKTHYSCFLDEGTPLPMMYMPDCLRATWELMSAPRATLKRSTYNLTAMSFTPVELERSIAAHLPDFQARVEGFGVRGWGRTVMDVAAQ